MAQAPINNTSSTQAGRVSASPWEDELEIQETPPTPKPMVIGSLGDEADPAENRQPVPFAVPERVEEKVGQKVPAQKVIEVKSSPVVPPQSSAPTNRNENKPEARAMDLTKPIVSPSPLRESEKALGLKTINLPDTGRTKPADQTVRQNQTLGRQLPPKSSSPKFGFPKNIPFLIGSTILLLLAGGTYLTERGVLAVGLEKIYGAFGVERIWGGLPKSAERALLVSAVATKQQVNFKAKGSLSLTIDKSIKSPITSPLVALSGGSGKSDERIAILVQAAKIATQLAQSDSDYNNYYDYYNSSGSTNDPDVDSSGVSPVTDSDTGSQSSSTSSQDSYPSYQYQGTSTKEINSEINAVFGEQGNESEIQVKKVTGTYKINLKNQGEKLWVKADNAIKFSDNAAPTKWLEYNLASMADKQIQKEILSFSPGLGFSVKGTRVGNEKIGGVRAYHYRLDSLEIGRSLEGAGITSDMVQSIGGDVWIGVRDKLIKRIELEVTNAPSSSVTALNVKIDFYDQGATNNFIVPENGETITSSGVSNLNANDIQRKSDLAAIQDALEAYKSVGGSYPVSANFTNLSQANNILEQALAPDYLAALPADPKAGESWYYGYKSDGINYTLSARFENTQDPEVTNVGGIYLHYVYNK